MSLKLVPFNPTWVQHDKIDVHAIYRRPRYVEDKFGEMQREHDRDGLPTWDLTGPLPVRQHTRWAAKGFQYVTLANRESLFIAAKYNTLPEGTNAREFDQHQTGGPWSYRRYLEGQEVALQAEAEQLRDDVAEFGSVAVETIRRRFDPGFVMPEHLKNVAPRGQMIVVAKDDDAKPSKRKQEVAS